MTWTWASKLIQSRFKFIEFTLDVGLNRSICVIDTICSTPSIHSFIHPSNGEEYKNNVRKVSYIFGGAILALS